MSGYRNMRKPRPYTDYIYIRAWGMLLGSYDYYIVGQQKRAASEFAPADAIYTNGDGTWKTIHDLKPDTQMELAACLSQMQ